MTTSMQRREFLRRGAVLTGAGLLSAMALDRLALRQANAQGVGATVAGEGYGPLARAGDQNGLNVLALPAGFSYVTFGAIGSTMSDGNRTPLALDGMAASVGRAAWCASSATTRTATSRARARWAATRARSTTARQAGAPPRSTTTRSRRRCARTS